ncbi:hypothetical protein [Methanobacterium ferruginis]|uniref:hypothetical protein n=1 Tax=Methanobacterium ferruginis TaxID=710191 RepID=UPI002572CF4C|nr:hypothetical protein [Methanobacterium ferruginis]BDZ68386.1 hypothetical protein GCM10025860_18340 [Methanobacterium ferruginis]
MRIPFKKDKPGNNKLNKEQKTSKGLSKLNKCLKKYLHPQNGNINILVLAVAIIVFIGVVLALFSFNGNPVAIFTTSSQVSSTILAKTNDSYVTKEGPYGNTSSNVTIAYIAGVHPRESAAHQAIIESIRESDASLEKQYYLYIINAPLYEDNYPQERMNGQLLANKYVVPDIINNSYQLAVDVHSSNGSYSSNRFVFTPIQENKSMSIARELKNKISWLKYYYPPDPSSTEYVTIPLIKAGVPSIVYETYKYDSNTTTREHAKEFIEVIDESQLFT